MRRSGKSKNLIWTLAVLVLLTVLSAVGVKDAFPASIALEQAPRCGMEEHVHDESCYVGDILVCREKMHTHTENCYLVLLEDNNINELLTRIDVAPDNNLETLISATVLQASAAAQRSGGVELEGPLASASPSPSVTPTISPSLFPSISPSLTPSMTPSLIPTLSPSPSVSPSADPETTPTASPSQSVTANQPLSVTQRAQPITNQQIVMLNAVVDTSQQGVVLNEHLVTANLTESASEEELLASLLSGGTGSVGDVEITVPTPGTLTENTGVSTLAVTGTEGDRSNNKLNLYIKVNGEYQNTETTLSFDVDDSQNISILGAYVPYCSQTALLNAVKVYTGVSDLTASTITVKYGAFGATTGDNDAGTGTYDNTASYTFGSYGWSIIGDTDSSAASASASAAKNVFVDSFYTVTFKYNDGTTADVVKYVQSGQTVTEPTDPTCSGYTFGGWYTDETCTNEYDFSTTVTAKTTLYAKWERNQVTVTFDSQGGSTVASQTFDPGGKATEPNPPPTRVGHIFGGWYADVDCTTEFDFEKTAITTDTVIYAKWTITKYTIIWKNEDGTVLEVDENVEYGSTPSYDGATPVKPNPEEGHTYTFAGWTPPTATVTGDATYTATYTDTINTYTVTFDSQGGSTVASQTVEHGSMATEPTAPTREGYNFLGWYTADGQKYDFDTLVTGELTLSAKWEGKTYTITYLDVNGNELKDLSFAYTYGSGNIILPDLPDGASQWRDNSELDYYNEGVSVTPKARNYVFQAVNSYAVTLIDENGDETVTVVTSGGSYTLTAPGSGYVWEDQDGNTYSDETKFTINSNLTFTKKGYLTVNYNVNFNTTSAANVSITTGTYTVPTVMNGSTYSHSLTQGATEMVCAPSATEVTEDFLNYPLSSSDTSRPGVAVFQGWQVTASNGDTHVFQPGEVLTYSELAQYASNGTVTLTGQWTYTGSYSVNFFVRYSNTSTGTGSSFFTPVVWSAYYAGLSSTSGHNILSATEDLNGDGVLDKYDIDIYIRSLTDRTQSEYLNSFPSDEYIFEILQNYVNNLFVDGIAVQASDLNEHGYTILWTKLNYQGDPTFHVDGELVRKVGYIYVTKTFAGNEEAVAAAKAGGYTIDASVTRTTTVDGESVTTTTTLPLNLNAYDADSNPYGYESYDADTDTYTWKISGVAYDEKWTLTENNYAATVDGVKVTPYMEYTVSDALGKQSRHGEYQGSVTVTGQTYDHTVSTDEMLTVSFTNIYPGTDSFILKKEDTDTGNALAGASFSLYQNGSILRFKYEDGIYTADDAGTVTELDCTSGFLEITVKGLDFSLGNITVRETETPEGYISLADSVELTKVDDAIVIAAGDSDSARFTNGVLIIGNSASKATVTITKKWANEADARSVVVDLLANGSLATTLFPNLSDVSAIVTLNEDNSYTYTWKDLPAYADGELITWSAVEVRIGDERANSDGSFDNWTVVYSNPVVTMGADGNLTVDLTVTNAKKDGNTLVVYKTDENGTALSGVQFLLQMLTEDGAISTDFTAQTGTTDNSGLLTFSGLPYGDYKITEIVTPAGYIGVDTVAFTVNSDQTITVTDSANGAATAVDGMLVLKVVNTTGVELPATGGSGTTCYTLGGALLMAAALLMLYQKSRRKEDAPYV